MPIVLYMCYIPQARLWEVSAIHVVIGGRKNRAPLGDHAATYGTPLGALAIRPNSSKIIWKLIARVIHIARN